MSKEKRGGNSFFQSFGNIILSMNLLLAGLLYGSPLLFAAPELPKELKLPNAGSEAEVAKNTALKEAEVARKNELEKITQDLTAVNVKKISQEAMSIVVLLQIQFKQLPAGTWRLKAELKDSKGNVIDTVTSNLREGVLDHTKRFDLSYLWEEGEYSVEFYLQPADPNEPSKDLPGKLIASQKVKIEIKPESVPLLVSALTQYDRAKFRASAEAALKKLGDSAIEPLKQLLDKKDLDPAAREEANRILNTLIDAKKAREVPAPKPIVVTAPEKPIVAVSTPIAQKPASVRYDAKSSSVVVEWPIDPRATEVFVELTGQSNDGKPIDIASRVPVDKGNSTQIHVIHDAKYQVRIIAKRITSENKVERISETALVVDVITVPLPKPLQITKLNYNQESGFIELGWEGDVKKAEKFWIDVTGPNGVFSDKVDVNSHYSRKYFAASDGKYTFTLRAVNSAGQDIVAVSQAIEIVTKKTVPLVPVPTVAPKKLEAIAKPPRIIESWRNIEPIKDNNGIVTGVNVTPIPKDKRVPKNKVQATKGDSVSIQFDWETVPGANSYQLFFQGQVLGGIAFEEREVEGKRVKQELAGGVQFVAQNSGKVKIAVQPLDKAGTPIGAPAETEVELVVTELPKPPVKPVPVSKEEVPAIRPVIQPGPAPAPAPKPEKAGSEEEKKAKEAELRKKQEASSLTILTPSGITVTQNHHVVDWKHNPEATGGYEAEFFKHVEGGGLKKITNIPSTMKQNEVAIVKLFEDPQLGEGTYTLKIRSLFPNDVKGQWTEYTFKVEFPWRAPVAALQTGSESEKIKALSTLFELAPDFSKAPQEIQQAVQKAEQDPSDKIKAMALGFRDPVIKELVKLGLVAGEQTKAAQQAESHLGDAKISKETKLHIIQVLPTFGDASVAPLVRSLENEDKEIEMAVLSAFSLLGKVAVDPLIDTLKNHKNPKVQAKAATALGRTGYSSESVIEFLLAVSVDHKKEELVRSSAKDAFLGLGEASVPRLIEALDDKDLDIRSTAQAILRKMANQKGVNQKQLGNYSAELLVKALYNQTPHVRYYVFDLLVLIGEPARASLERVKNDSQIGWLVQGILARIPRPAVVSQ